MAPVGDGASTCSPSSQLLQRQDAYITNGIGTLACDQGRDIAYPEGAPGFTYDPTGYLLTLPGRQVCYCNSNMLQSSVHSQHVPIFFCLVSRTALLFDFVKLGVQSI